MFKEGPGDNTGCTSLGVPSSSMASSADGVPKLASSGERLPPSPSPNRESLLQGLGESSSLDDFLGTWRSDLLKN